MLTFKTLKQKKCIGIAVGALLMSQSAFAWGVAVHAYMTEKLTEKLNGIELDSAVYGALMPDCYNVAMLDKRGSFLYHTTHTDYMKLVNVATTCQEKSAAFGFAIHNEIWGGDYSSHKSSHMYPGQGWILARAALLSREVHAEIMNFLTKVGLRPEQAIPIADRLAPDFSHLLIETGVDIQLRRNLDPQIGQKMKKIVLRRSRDLPKLLVSAYSQPLAEFAEISEKQASRFILNGETGARMIWAIYGMIISKEPKVAHYEFSREYTKKMESNLEAELKAVNVPMQSGTVPLSVISNLLQKAIDLVGMDWESEVNQAMSDIETRAVSDGLSPCTQANLR